MSSTPSWAVKGAKVVSIRADAFLRPPTVRHPIVGETLTIADTDIDLFGRCGLVFEELGDDDCYLVDCFRPLVTRSQEQDIAEHFSHHLRRDVPARERA